MTSDSSSLTALRDLTGESLPVGLRAKTYFDWAARPFAHGALFAPEEPDAFGESAVAALDRLPEYLPAWFAREMRAATEGCVKWKPMSKHRVFVHGSVTVYVAKDANFSPRNMVAKYSTLRHNRLYVGPKAEVLGADFYLESGEIFIGGGTRLDGAAVIEGPAIIGEGCRLRPGAHLRGPVIVGDGCDIGGVVERSILLPGVQAPHAGTIADSVCGVGARIAPNVTIVSEDLAEPDVNRPVTVEAPDGSTLAIDTGRARFGALIGDHATLGAASVLGPAAFVKPGTVIAPQSRVV